MNRNRLPIVSGLLAGLLVISSVALADHEEGHDEDTIGSFGYDADNHVLAVNLGDNHTPWVCSFGSGALTAAYPEVIEGFFQIESLLSEGSEWQFAARDADEVSDDHEPAHPDDQSPFSDGECPLQAVLLSGKFNHGQFIKAAKSLIDGKAKGCLIREFAKSDIGRTEETRIRTPEVEEDFEPADEGQIEFTTFVADCEKPNNKPDMFEDTGRGERGKSDVAPGHNKGDD